MSRTVIIIDDDTITLDLMVSIIEESLDAVVYSYSDARLAKTFIADQREQTVDLIITDLQMPKVSGLDLLNFLKTGSFAIPVLLVSAQGTKDTVIKAIKSGAAGFIVKPFLKQDLIDKANALLFR